MLKVLVVVLIAIVLAVGIYRRGSSAKSIDPGLQASPDRVDIDRAELVPASSGERQATPSVGQVNHDEGSHALLLVVDGQEATPLPAATAHDTSGRLLGATGQDGVMALTKEPASLGWVELLISAPAYAEATCILDWSQPSTTVRLHRPTTIRGFIEAEHGVRPSHVDILAWPTTAVRPTAEQARVILAGGEGGVVQHATMNSDGSFEIAGVSPVQEYTLVAGGSGFVTAEYSTVSPKAEGPVVLQLMKVFGLRVTLITSEGSSIPLGDPRVGRRVVRRGCDALGASPIDLPELGFVLATGGNSAGEGIISLYSSAEGGEFLDQCWVEVACPGFDDARVTERARSLELGPTDSTLLLVQASGGFGSLAVMPHGYDPLMAEWIGGAFVMVSLTGADTGKTESVGGFMHLVKGCVIQGVPAGLYDWTVVAREGLWRSSEPAGSSRVLIESEEISEIRVDASAAGALIVRPRTPEGDVYWSSIAMGVAPGIPAILPDGGRRLPNGYVYSPKKGPYVLPLLAPGQYTLRGMGPRWGAPTEEGWLTVNVQAGAWTEVEVLIAAE